MSQNKKKLCQGSKVVIRDGVGALRAATIELGLTYGKFRVLLEDGTKKLISYSEIASIEVIMKNGTHGTVEAVQEPAASTAHHGELLRLRARLVEELKDKELRLTRLERRIAELTSGLGALDASLSA